MWLSNCPTVSISKGCCLKAKAVYDRRIITLVCCNRLVAGYCILWKMLNDDIQ